MLTRMQNVAHMILGTNKKPSANFDTEPTRWSWAKQIESYDTVPDTYQSFFQSLLESNQTFPYTILTPFFNRFMFKSNEKLVCDLGDELIILERFGNTFEVQRYPIDGIIYVEVRTILLDSQIKICGLNRDGVNASSTLKFNSVTDYLFEPILKKIRLAHVISSDIKQNTEAGKFDGLISVNFKFMNYARHSVLAGEKVLLFILQPEIQTKILKLFGTTYYRTIHPTHIVILTDWELIIIREEKIAGDRSKYGGAWDFIPLKKIKKMSLSQNDPSLLMLSIQLSETAPIELPFLASAKEEVNQLITSFGKLTTK